VRRRRSGCPWCAGGSGGARVPGWPGAGAQGGPWEPQRCPVTYRGRALPILQGLGRGAPAGMPAGAIPGLIPRRAGHTRGLALRGQWDTPGELAAAERQAVLREAWGHWRHGGPGTRRVGRTRVAGRPAPWPGCIWGSPWLWDPGPRGGKEPGKLPGKLPGGGWGCPDMAGLRIGAARNSLGTDSGASRALCSSVLLPSQGELALSAVSGWVAVLTSAGGACPRGTCEWKLRLAQAPFRLEAAAQSISNLA